MQQKSMSKLASLKNMRISKKLYKPHVNQKNAVDKSWRRSGRPSLSNGNGNRWSGRDWLANMIRERDQARFDVIHQNASHKDDMDRIRRELNFANFEQAEDASRSKSSGVSSMLGKYNRPLTELEDSLRARISNLIIIVQNPE